MYIRAASCSTVTNFGTSFAQSFLLARYSDDGHNRQFPIPVVVQTSLVMRPSSWISAPALCLVSVVTAVAVQPLWGLSTVSFVPRIKLSFHTIHASQQHLYRPGAFSSKKFNHHTLPSTAVHNTCYFVERTWLTEAPMILVEVNSVAIGSIRQQTLPGAPYERNQLSCIGSTRDDLNSRN
jgi:hypothetical protein